MANYDSDQWQVYVLQCGDESFYTGIAKDVVRRLDQHARGQGARYTRGRGPLAIWWRSETMSHGQALALERRIKAMTRAQKVQLRERRQHDASQSGMED